MAAALGVAAGLAACGGSGAHSRTATAASSASVSVTPPGPAGHDNGVRHDRSGLLVFLRRTVGVDPLSSELSIYRDGWSVAVITSGGVAGQHRETFRLTPARRAAFGALIARARRGGLHDTPFGDIRLYNYYLDTAGRSVRYGQRDIPAAARPLMREANRLLDAHTND